MDQTRSQADETVSAKSSAAGRAPLARGAAVGRYLLLDPIGQGGMGVVYKAYDPDLDRTIALKLMRAGDIDAGQLRERLLREAQALARLQHPNVVAVHDVGTFRGDVFIAMELVAGPTLRAWLKAQPRRPREILDVFLEAGKGLAAAHRAGLVHRDFKPDNVILGDDGRVRVVDFGLARTAIHDADGGSATSVPASELEVTSDGRAASPVPKPAPQIAPTSDTPASAVSATPSAPSGTNLLASPLTHAGAVVGTPRFMAPEQHLGAGADERADQFSFCVSLYHALYGAFPFAGDTTEQMIDRVLEGRVSEPPPGSKVPRWLRQVLLKGLAREADQRYPSMEALLAALAADPNVVRRRRLGLAAALVVVATVGGSLGVLRRREVRACAGAADKLAGVWDDARRAKVHTAFAATRAPYAEVAFTAVANAFDRYAHDWVAMRTDACEATQLRREQSAELLDLRMSCLDDRLTQLQTLSDVYAAADARVVEHANDWAAALPGLAPCADAVALRAPTPPPRDPDTRRRVDAIRHNLARAHALGLALKADDGLALVRAAQKEAEAIGYRPVEAETQLRLGELMQIKGDYAGAPAVLHRGLVAAFASRADDIAADIAIASLDVDLHQSHFPDAERWADLAEALASRLSRKDERLGEIYTARANILRYESKLEPALAEAKRGLALLQKVYGPDDYRVAGPWKALALIYYYRTEYPQALDAYEHALDLQQRALGPNHPRVITLLIGMADVYGDSGNHDKAIALYRQALETQLRVDPNNQNVELVYGNMSNDYLQLGRPREAFDLLQRSLERIQKRIGPSVEMVFALTNLGLADVEMHKWSEALAYSEQAMAMCAKLVGQNSLQYGQALAGSARAEQGLGRLEEAEARYRRALALDEKVLGPKHPELVTPLLGLAQVALARGNPAAARAPLERGLALTEGYAILDVDACDYRLALAKVEWASGNRARAVELAQRARDGYAKAGSRGKEGLAEAAAWLAHHG